MKARQFPVRRAEWSIGGPARGPLRHAGLDDGLACCVVRAHDCVRLKEPNDVNGAARPSEHCSKQSSDSPMPPLSSRLPASHSSLTRNNMKGRQFPCLEKSLCITASRKSSSRRLHRSAHSDSNQNDLHCHLRLTEPWLQIIRSAAPSPDRAARRSRRESSAASEQMKNALMQMIATSLRNDFRGNLRELVNLARENFDAQGRREPVTELVAVTDQRHPQPETRQRSKKSDDCPLAEKDPDDLRRCSRRSLS